MTFIDGFNLYHAIDDAPVLRSFKWLDVVGLSKSLLKEDELLEKAHFFTTIVPWSQEKAERHREYIHALEWAGAKIILGEFHTKSVQCKLCGKIFEKYEEKKTDVNIAVELMRYAYADAFDTAIVISGDSDLTSALQLIKDVHPEKCIAVGIPPNRKAKHLKAVSHFSVKILQEHIIGNQLPARITLPNGHRIISPYS
jgi:uncharacterized LabA/DUF88 family protein